MVTGRVQGVGYRASVAREAEAAGLSGFARNVVDGSVVVELEGSAASVDALLAWCRIGTRWSEVERVAVQEIAPVGSTTFEIR